MALGGRHASGEAKSDVWIIAQLFKRLKALYLKEGGKFPDPILNLHWPYKDPDDPTPAEIAKEINGYVVADVPDPADSTKLLLQKGKQVVSFAASTRRATTWPAATTATPTIRERT